MSQPSKPNKKLVDKCIKMYRDGVDGAEKARETRYHALRLLLDMGYTYNQIAQILETKPSVLCNFFNRYKIKHGL